MLLNFEICKLFVVFKLWFMGWLLVVLRLIICLYLLDMMYVVNPPYSSLSSYYSLIPCKKKVEGPKSNMVGHGRRMRS